MILTVVSASMRVPSSTATLADRLVDAVVAAVAAREVGAEVRRVEVRELAHDVVDATLTGFPRGALADALADVAAADALVLVTPIYQASYAGLFKSLLDLVEAGSLRGAPTLVAATGGTERHSLALDHAVRPLVSYLGGVTVPTGVYAATQDFGAGSGALAERIERAAEELATLVAGASVRAKPADPFAEVTPFEQLLGDLRR